MSTVQIPVGYADCAVHFRRTGDPEDMVITFGVATADADNTASNVALGMGFTFASAQMPSGMRCDRVVCRVAVEGDAPVVQEASVNINGSASTDIAPSNVAILWRKITTHGGRRGRGRLYLPWAVDTQIDTIGLLASTYLTLNQTLADTCLTALADTTHGASTPMVVLHREGHTAIPLPYPVTAIRVDPMVATQRQRMRR